MKSKKGPRLERCSDELILALCRAKQDNAWRVLMRRHASSIPCWIPRNKVDGRPLVSAQELETFVAHTWGFVATKIHTFKPGRPGTGRAWLRRVVRSSAGDFRRKLHARVKFQARVEEDVRSAPSTLRTVLAAERLGTARKRFRRRPSGINPLNWLAAKLVYASVSFVGPPTTAEILAAGKNPAALAATIPIATSQIGRMGLPPKKVAKLLGMKVNTVHAACHRVRRAIAG